MLLRINIIYQRLRKKDSNGTFVIYHHQSVLMSVNVRDIKPGRQHFHYQQTLYLSARVVETRSRVYRSRLGADKRTHGIITLPRCDRLPRSAESSLGAISGSARRRDVEEVRQRARDTWKVDGGRKTNDVTRGPE